MYHNAGLIGHPLSHSISPLIHNYFYHKSRINGGYCCFDIDKNEIAQIIHTMKKFNFKGFNVTLPYKTDIIDFLDEIDLQASKINAVNTVKIMEGKLFGYNTDLFGIEKTFEKFEIELSNKKILILGSGGAARPLFYFLKDKNANVDIVNRTVKNTETVLEQLEIYNFNNFDLLFLKKNNYYDIIVNTTSVGIDKKEFFDMSHIDCGEFAFDFQYSIDGCTPFLDIYKNSVPKYTDGLLMLIYQGLKAFGLFNDVKLEIDINELKKFILKKG
ncbi:MAG: shikimate 5-dehydrogenase [Deferribacteraceae bacterium]|jgi:shikimate dehydrogenase|nr:shikimate 5-dehydrogenase [Deferribacteraceae bacterium]